MGRRQRVNRLTPAIFERHNLMKKVVPLCKGGGRSVKNMARMIILEKKEFSDFEQQFIDENPEFKGKVSEDVHVVKAYTGFEVIDGNPFLDAEWEKTRVPFILCNVNLPETQKSFGAAGNEDKFDKMLQFVDENPRYLVRIYNPVLEELDGNNDEQAETQRRAILEAGEKPKKNHPKKSPKSPRKHPRSFFHTKPDESSAPITDSLPALPSLFNSLNSCSSCHQTCH